VYVRTVFGRTKRSVYLGQSGIWLAVVQEHAESNGIECQREPRSGSAARQWKEGTGVRFLRFPCVALRRLTSLALRENRSPSRMRAPTALHEMRCDGGMSTDA
jgi:hypothetical protein